MRNNTPTIDSAVRILDFLEAILADHGATNVSALAARNGVPISTAHRQVKTLVQRGYLVSFAKGRHVAGASLARLAQHADPLGIMATAARPLLDRLTRRFGGTAHLGILENDMVTYLVKTGDGAHSLFTREGQQLEAYCSGIGKILLAHLPDEDRARYLAGGPFIPLTTATITAPDALASDLDASKTRGFAIDNREIADDLRCLAVPVFGPASSVTAAISLSHIDGDTRKPDAALVRALATAADRLSQIVATTTVAVG